MLDEKGFENLLRAFAVGDFDICAIKRILSLMGDEIFSLRRRVAELEEVARVKELRELEEARYRMKEPDLLPT